MEYEKFKVNNKFASSSGKYVEYTREDGGSCITADLGFNIGDVIERYGFDGYMPKRLIVNGVERNDLIVDPRIELERKVKNATERFHDQES
jgi:hypothetical protein